MLRVRWVWDREVDRLNRDVRHRMPPLRRVSGVPVNQALVYLYSQDVFSFVDLAAAFPLMIVLLAVHDYCVRSEKK